MTGGGSGTGSDGSFFDADALQFPGVPYGPNDFHGTDDCPTSDQEIHDYNNPIEVRNCRLVGLRDLDGSANYVRDMEAEFANRLISWGVAGFRLDACKHMWPGDLEAILGRLNQLNTQWFPAGSNAYVFQEVIDMGGEPITASEYTYLGRVTEFKHGQNLANVIRKNNGQRLAYLVNFGEAWGQLNGFDALVFIDNHDNQRSRFNETPLLVSILRCVRLYVKRKYYYTIQYDIILLVPVSSLHRVAKLHLLLIIYLSFNKSRLSIWTGLDNIGLRYSCFEPIMIYIPKRKPYQLVSVGLLRFVRQVDGLSYAII